MLRAVAVCSADDKRQWIADVQCHIQTEAESVQSCSYCYYTVQKDDGLVCSLMHCCLMLIFERYAYVGTILMM